MALGNPFNKNSYSNIQDNRVKEQVNDLTVLCNSADKLIGMTSRYFQLSNILSFMSFDVIVEMIHMIDYFAYVIFSKLSDESDV